MTLSSARSSLADELLDAHHRLDAECRDRGERIFVGDWYCEHPFIGTMLRAENSGNFMSEADLLAYHFHSDDSHVRRLIGNFHEFHMERRPSPAEIFVTAGMSPLITAEMFLLRRRGVRRLYYVRPLYYTFYFLAETLGIELVPVNSGPLLDGSQKLDLPSEAGQWLLLTDPVWFVGRRIYSEYINDICAWQTATNGMVLLDGAFQYQRWQGNDLPEQTSGLVSSQTVRNICPTKAAAIHGIRFAYALLPAEMQEELRYCYSNTTGSGSVYDRRAAYSIMNWLVSEKRGILQTLISQRYAAMVKHRMFEDPLGAEASYFCFVRVPVDHSRLITMDRAFFDTTAYDGMTRLNLLMPRADLIKYIDLALDATGQPVQPEARERILSE